MSSSLSRRDRLIPWYFVAFFAFIALVDGIMVALAIRTHTGIVTAHPYEEGLHYNKTIEAAEAQAVRDWKATIAYADGVLTFILNDGKGTAVDATNVWAELRRPTDSAHDFTVTLTAVGDGIYRAPTAFPLKGQWDARVYATTAEGDFQRSKRLLVP